MSRRVGLGVLALAALAAAAILALLADAVFRVSDDLEARADALAEAGPPAGAGGPAGLRIRVARALLGVGADADFVEALEEFERARRTGLPPEQALELHARAEAELARIAGEGADRARRSRAASLNGVLLVEDAQLDRASAPRFLQLGLEAFRQAVALDPGNDEAKYNLELLAALLARGEGALGTDSGSEGASGAGASPGGSGY